ncbi:MAG: enoyl-CoA hydratase-related protein [Candidatus Nanopelagicales bacterium]|nr:enoyl-CoA hydratase-related protein [Candidatus Nanopelagicales bacterium]
MSQVPADAGSAPAPEVRLEVAGQMATITMNRPEARNMLTASGMALLAEHLRTAGAEPTVRVIVITGSGNTFCSGADLRGASAADAQSFTGSGPAALVAVLEAILDSPKPVIARVQGHVAGGGNGLVAAADLSVAAESAKFAFSEVRLGLAPAVISVVCLARMHRADAQELLLTGDRVPAARMVAAGMVNRVVADEDLDGAVDAWVTSLVAGGPEALTHTKDLLRVVPGMTRQEGFAHTAALSAQLFASPEAAAGMMAFLSRQPAPWVPKG